MKNKSATSATVGTFSVLLLNMAYKDYGSPWWNIAVFIFSVILVVDCTINASKEFKNPETKRAGVFGFIVSVVYVIFVVLILKQHLIPGL